MAVVSKVVNGGIAMMNNRLKNGDTGATEPNNVHWGTGTTMADVTDTALQTPAGEVSTVGVSTLVTTNTLDDTYELVATLVCGSTPKAITEVGVFDGAGVLFSRSTFDPINVAEGDSIRFTIKTVTDQA